MDKSKQQALHSWNETKYKIHMRNRVPQINDGEIWWCSVGENVNIEINGKGELSTRPVLIFKKLSRLGFLGIPLTSQRHDGSWHVHFCFHNQNEWAALSQVRVYSTSRLCKRLGTIDETDFSHIKTQFRALFCPD